MRSIRGAALCLMLATCALAGGGCKKEKESLVLAQLQLAAPDARAASLLSVSLAATPGPTRTFALSSLSADTASELGLYLPGDITGTVAITAVAFPKTGCTGFRGSGTVQIPVAGTTAPVTISMTAGDVCGSDGGSAGTGGGSGAGGGGASGAGGTAGGTGGASGAGGAGGAAGAGGATGGAGGSGGAGGGGGYPVISNCRMFNHAANSACSPSVSVSSVAISPNGQVVATGGDDDRVKIWSFDGRTLTATTTVLTGFNAYTVAFSPDGTRLAYTSNPDISTANVRLYNVPAWTAGPTLQDDGSGNTLRGVAFTPDSQRVVSVNAIGFAGGDVFVHNVTGSTLPVYTAHIPNEPYSLAVLGARAPNNGSIGVAVGSYYGTATLLSLTATGFTANPATLPASTTSAVTYSLQFSPDGSLLATGESTGAVRFWANPPAASPTPIGGAISFAGGDSVNAVAFTPNGSYLAAGGAFSVKQLSIYSVATHAEVDRTTPAGGDVTALAISPSGTALIAGLDACGYVLVCSN